MKIFGWIVFGIIMIVIGIIWSGYALSILWEWFVVPVFNLPLLTIPQAIGIAMIISYITYKFNDVDKDKDKSLNEKFTYQIFLMLFKPAFALFFGWIVTAFL